MDVGVYKSINEKKGIIAINFINPLSGKKTTKSLGKEIGLNEKRADEIISDVKLLINDSRYYEDYSSYLAAKDKFDEIAIKVVFQNTDLLRSYDEENVSRSIENKISIKKEDGKQFQTYSVQFIGVPGAGKTKTIQQILGSIKHNVPATTTSNTTVGSFEAYITESKELKCVGAIISKEELQEQLLYNVYSAMEEALMHEDDDGELYSSVYNTLLSSKNLKFKLYILLGRKIDNKSKLIIEEIISIANKTWSIIKVEKNIGQTMFRNVSKDIKQLVRLAFEEHDIISSEVDELIKSLHLIIESKMLEVFNSFISLVNEKSTITYVDMEIVTNSRIIVKDPKLKLEMLKLDKDEWIGTFYFSIWLENNVPNRTLRDEFFDMLKFFSCANENEENLLPLVSKLRIKGNFRGLWQDDFISVDDVIILDSEGVGHDSDQIGFSSDIEENMLFADKIMWIIDSTKGFNKQEKSIIKTLAVNGSLPKTICGFNRLEKMDANSEKTQDSKKYRLKQLIENLFASFENDDIDDVDYSKLKHILIENQLCFEYLDRFLDDSELYPKEIDEMLLLNDIDEEIKKILKCKYPPINIESTTKSLEKIINDRGRVPDRNFPFKVPIYSYIKLSNLCDAAVIKFVDEFSKDVDAAHWNTVRAFTYRMFHNISNRGWWFLQPETQLKSELKIMLLSYFMNPNNFNNDEIIHHTEWFQIVQEEISRALNDMVKQEMHDSLKKEWEKVLKLSGVNSGNDRKYQVKKIVIDKYHFDRNKNIENILFVDFVKLLDNIKSLKEKNVKFVIV